MTDKRDKGWGRGEPTPERFTVYEFHPTAHLTEEQKTWRVMRLVHGCELVPLTDGHHPPASTATPDSTPT